MRWNGRIWLALIYLFISSLFGYTILLFPAVLFVSPFSLNAFYQWVDFCLSLWLRNTNFILENVWSVRLHFYTKSALAGHSADTISQFNKVQLIVANHASNFDWMYLWVWLAKIGKLRHVRNILKSELRCVPGFGWAMECAAFVFLRRNWLYDRETIQRMLRTYRKISNESTLILFPEGTNMSDITKQKSNAFALKQGLEPYQYCLHPRTTGFNAIASDLVDNNGLNTIIDVTIAFKGPYPVEPSDLVVSGILPKDIFIMYAIHDISHLQTPEQREEWLLQRWKEKESTLQRFNSNGCFDDDVFLLPTRSWYRRAKWIGFIFWFIVTTASLIALYKYRSFRVYVLVVVTSTLIINRFFSGITELILS